MSGTVLLNGEMVAASDARLSVYDGGWLHGAGLFETIRAENRKAFRWEAHLERLRRSGESLLTPIPRQALPTPADVSTLLLRNGLTTARLRLTVSAGSMLQDRGEQGVGPTVCLTASELTPYAPDMYEKGVAVVICPFRVSPTDPLAGHKTTAYLPRLLGLRDAQQARCFESLWFTTESHLAEGCISNVFVFKRGVLKTPPLGTPVLPGIARAVVLDLARAEAFDTQERPLTIDDLLDADELLLTNSIMQVMPVTRVERHDIAEGRVGAVARKLLTAYRAAVHRECGHG